MLSILFFEKLSSTAAFFFKNIEWSILGLQLGQLRPSAILQRSFSASSTEPYRAPNDAI